MRYDHNGVNRMKKWFQYIVIALLLVWVYPAFVLSFLPDSQENPNTEQTHPSSLDETRFLSENVQVKLLEDGVCGTIELEEYLTGVILAELPGDFHYEAKKAQAVVARTYTIKTVLDGYKHGRGVICADSGCCQAYISEEAYLNRGGVADILKEAREAVQATAHEVIRYGEDLIDATYFSCSGGMTEDAVAVWGTDIPYLQAVESPGEEHAAAYLKTFRFSVDTFCELLSINSDEFRRFGIGDLTYTDGFGVNTIALGGRKYDGTDLRMKLKLPSTVFSITYVGDSVIITTRGFGHRVGMSQYGADAMARVGQSYVEIIQHYYQGVEVMSYIPEEH